MNWQSHEPCTACGTMSVDRCYHHIYTRKARPDLISERFNQIPVCSLHHLHFHSKGTLWMANKFPSVREWLESNDWYICELTGKYTHD